MNTVLPPASLGNAGTLPGDLLRLFTSQLKSKAFHACSRLTKSTVTVCIDDRFYRGMRKHYLIEKRVDEDKTYSIFNDWFISHFLPNGRQEGLEEYYTTHGYTEHPRWTQMWENGIQEGYHVSYYCNRRVRSACPAKNGKQHGLELSWGDMGHLLSSCEWKNGKRHGIAYYYHNQTPAERRTIYSRVPWKNGKRHGLAEVWHRNGLRSYKCLFANNKRIGLEKEWDSEGNLVDAHFYD